MAINEKKNDFTVCCLLHSLFYCCYKAFKTREQKVDRFDRFLAFAANLLNVCSQRFYRGRCACSSELSTL